MKTPADMYNLALQSGYNLYYATAVFLARQEIVGFNPKIRRAYSTDLAKELRLKYEVQL